MTMRKITVLAISLLISISSPAMEPVKASIDHEQLLASSDPKLAANKLLVYDFYRKVFEGGHLELADIYLDESYIQHNPNVPTGRDGFVQFFSHFKPKPIPEKMKAPLVSIVAEGDLVVLSFVREGYNSKSKKSYSTTWFDMFRVKDGKIIEHWDPAI